ncbi:unnamed protein product [Adineta steineri]|uniref:Uncharacterized protein n=2 Tax=Adineta steineri TaxID=433720 RepID=A0A814F5X8_9BILA|nr:unnamed protein product [Adineta steineri]CAF3793046.1 unnamed protein product [Adineta steineri]
MNSIGQTTQLPDYSCSENDVSIQFILSSSAHSAWNSAANCSLQQCNVNLTNNMNNCLSSSTSCFNYRTINNITYCAPGILCSILERCNNITQICSSNNSICITNSCCSSQAVCLPFLAAQMCERVPSSPFIDYFASAATGNSIKVWNLNNGSLIFNLTGHKSKIRQLHKLNNNSVLSGSTDGVFRIWDMSDRSFIRTLDCSSSSTDVKFGLLPKGYIVGQCGYNTFNIWNISDAKLVNNFNTNYYYGIAALIVLSNGYIGTGTWFAPFQILDPMTGSLITTSSMSVTSLAFIQLPNGNIANGDWDHIIKIFNTTTGELVFNLVGHTGPVNSFELLANGYLASASCYRDDNTGYYGGDERILIWDPNNGSLVQILTGHTAFVLCLKLLNNGYLASGAVENTIKIWSPINDSLICTLTGHTGPVFELLFLSNGNLASRSNDKTIKVWNITSGSLLYTINGDVYPDWDMFKPSINLIN